MSKTVLVALDGSECADHALREACEIVQAQGSDMHLVHVAQFQPLVLGSASVMSVQPREELEAVGKKLLDSAAQHASDAGVNLDRVKLRGVDLDVAMVETAKSGHYRTKSFRAMPPDKMVRYFTPSGDDKVLKPSILSHLDFRWANLVDDKTLVFPEPLDIILCRNVLIYFNLDTIEHVARSFNRLLADDGFLVIGVSESLSNVPFLFDPARRGNIVTYDKIPL